VQERRASLEGMDPMPGATGSRLEADSPALKPDTLAEDLARTNLPVAGLREAMARLRGVHSMRELLELGPAELCTHCGFDRAALSRVDGSDLVIEKVHLAAPPSAAEEFLEVAHLRPPRLDHLLLETEMVRRGCALLVTDAANDPLTYKPLVEASQTTSYVAAPIMPSGRVIGFLHADHHITGREVDAVDRDIIAAFADAFGIAAERAALTERMNFQLRFVERQMRSASQVFRETAEGGIDLKPLEEGAAVLPPLPPASIGLPRESRLDSLLTRREAEVLALMAEGSTNHAIAERLVISEGTVKSHVKSILRKLRAANRAEAVSRYMKLQAG